MKCFYHPVQDAVGICKSCQKGVCVDCAVDLRKGLACRGSCEADVQGLIALIDSNMRISPVGTKVWRGYGANQLVTAGMTIVLGALFAGWAALQDPPLFLIVAVGVVFALWGVLQAAQALRLRAAARGADRVP
jgi:hypothetical protein